MKRYVLFFSMVFMWAYADAQFTVTGVVSDSGNLPLPGASVSVKGTTVATMTARDGSYSVEVPDSAAILVYSYIGMQTQEIETEGRRVINVIMQDSGSDIEEVVIVSYGKRKLINRTASAIKIRGASGITKGKSGRKNQSVNTAYDYNPDSNTEEYDQINEPGFRDVENEPLSTLSVDVDNAAYANVRRFINNNQLPPKDAVRIEEMINYFTYDYENPTGNHPFSITTELSECPWDKKHKLVHLGIQGKKTDYENLQPSNLVFLLDVSGSMNSDNKLPLLKKSFKMLVENLSENDKVSIVVYAGAAGLVLPPTSVNDKETIFAALDKLQAGGSTAGGAGIKLAYKTAKENFIKGGNNRVILATDGDFNVGVSSTGTLVNYIEKERGNDVYLTVLGFGMGNYKDGRMEQISNAGNGNYFYVDNIKEAEKVFVKEMRANMFTIAKDVKIQIEFNPAHVKSYRLIGYENRMLENEDFNDDTKDAGELGAGHTVTALYEIVPASDKSNDKTTKVDALKYQTVSVNEAAKTSSELMTVKFRYKPTDSKNSILITHVVEDVPLKLNDTQDNFRFSASVAAFGMLLRDSRYKGKADYDLVLNLAKSAKGKDTEGYRAEYISMVKSAKLLSD